MDVNKTNEVMEILNKIMEYELSGVVRYTHYALMITGRDRLSLTQFFKDQASESLLHAQEAANKHSTVDLLNESSEHEKEAVGLYKILLDIVKDESIYIEEYARGMIKAEEMHAIEVTKMLKDYAEA